MFDCTLTQVEVWADDASNFRTRWRFYNRMKERKVDAAARQPLVLSKKYFLPNVMQLKENGSFGRPLRINLMSRYICFSQIGPFDVSFEELFSKVQNPGGFFRKIVF